ncbi:MAG TPA: malto-oligosyltrehalose trehalohydrolase [Vicinamibacteria bacterium]
MGSEASLLGANRLGEGRCQFRVWAPYAEGVEVAILGKSPRRVPMISAERGYFEALVEDVPAGTRYRFRLLPSGEELPDPASRYQPEGVHGPSEVIAREFHWEDGGFRGIPLRDLVLYELHTGTFTEEGSFDAVVDHLDELSALGVNSIELMPVAEFPGSRNWGYDGVFPFAVQSSYGGPLGLKRLVDASHRRGLAVTLDVVYNHLGPEGNGFPRFGPYFTERYRTPWGPALNFDGADSDEVRRFFIENAIYWLEEFHIDALRLDAVHAIADNSPYPFLQELAEKVHDRFQGERMVYLFPESAANDRRLLRPRGLGGYGFDAVWNDDFHHALRTLLVEDRDGYYQDYGSFAHLVRAFREGFAYTGQYSSYRRRRHGTASKDLPCERFIVFDQNHDQVGNRPGGDRLATLVSLEKLKLGAASVLLSPYVPLLFMGEEYGETAPFPYFVSHSDPQLNEAVRRGRREEFSRFEWKAEPLLPDEAETFQRAVLERKRNPAISTLYAQLLRLRRSSPAFRNRSREGMRVLGHEHYGVLEVQYQAEEPSAAHAFALFHFGDGAVSVELALNHVKGGSWRKRFDSTAVELGGGGSDLPEVLKKADVGILLRLAPWSAVFYEWEPS